MKRRVFRVKQFNDIFSIEEEIKTITKVGFLIWKKDLIAYTWRIPKEYLIYGMLGPILKRDCNSFKSLYLAIKEINKINELPKYYEIQ